MNILPEDDISREAARLWVEFDNKYPMFQSNSLYSIQEGRRWYTFTDKYDKIVNIKIKCRRVSYDEYEGFDNRFKMFSVGADKSKYSSTYYKPIQDIYEVLDREEYLGGISFEDVKDPGYD